MLCEFSPYHGCAQEAKNNPSLGLLKRGGKKSAGALWSHLSWLQIYEAITVILEFGSVKGKKRKTPHACCKQPQYKKKALQGWGSLIDGLLFNPQSYGDKSFYWKLQRYCVTQGVRQRGGETAPRAAGREGVSWEQGWR